METQSRLQTLTSEARKHIEPLLLKLGTHDWADVEDAVLSGRCHLVSTPNAAMIGELVHYPKLTSFIHHFAGGDKQELAELQPNLEQWAKENGAKRIEIRGRRGWLREYKESLDHDNIFIQIQKDL